MTGNTAASINLDLGSAAAGAVTDQGARPTCLPIAVSVVHQVALSGTDYSSPLGPEPLWAGAMLAGEADATGSTPAGIGATLQGTGQPTLRSWPYNESIAADQSEAQPATCGTTGWVSATLREIPLPPEARLDGLLRVLAAGRAVVLLIETTDAFSFPALDGTITDPGPDSGDGSYHAVVLWGARGQGDSVELLIRNSWGLDWGDNGFCRMPASYLANYGVAAYEVLIPAL